MDRPELIKSRSGHGGDIYTDPSENWLDLSANINPRPLPLELYAALPKILDQARVYPDIEYEALRRDIAEYASKLSRTVISPDWIIPGNGALEILDKAMAVAQKVLIIRPCFSEYELSCIRHGVSYDTLDRQIDQSPVLGEGLFNQIREKLEKQKVARSTMASIYSTPSGDHFIDTIVLCNPNNPDGKRYEKKAFEKFLAHCAGADIRLIVDETFAEYLDDESMLLPLAGAHQNLLVVKALTKFFGLPGVRLGYGITSDHEWRREIAAGLTTWNLGAFAQGIAGILMKDMDFIQASRAENNTVREYLKVGLETIPLFDRIYPSTANFLMVYSENMPELIQQLKAHRILIRDLSGMPGLGHGYARIAVKDETSADRLLAELREIGSGRGKKLIPR